MKLYNDEHNVQFLKFTCLLTSALHVLGFLLAHLQRQVYKFGSGSGLLGMVSAPRPETCKAEVNRQINFKKLVHYVAHYTTSFQNSRSLQHKIR
jgi:hypothetical protein